MSGLAEVLAGGVPHGAYRWRSATRVDDVRDLVRHVGWRFAHLDGVRVETAAELHAALADELDLPEHYGHNLDALADCLRRMHGRQLLLWDDWGLLARADRRTFDVATALLGERMAVLLRGDGPDDVALPWVD